MLSIIKKFNWNKKPSTLLRNEIIQFLYKHLEEFRDPKEDIEKAIKYALKEKESFGGFILCGYIEQELVSVVIMNRTGMKDYIPENILVYIATHQDKRGKGIGRKMMEEALSSVEGNVALHVEPNNPARFLYQKLGFTNKYLEMRYIKSK